MNDLKGIIEDCNKSDLVSDKIIKKIIEIIGREEWQTLHDENNDVCTTMGELIIILKGVADLEKENAELEEDMSNAIPLLEKAKDINDQLIKAKELLNESNRVLKEHGLYHNELYKRTEQFLSEVEK